MNWHLERMYLIIGMSKTPRTKVRSVFLSISKMLRIFDDHRKSLISEMLGNRLFTSGESPGIAHGDFRHFNIVICFYHCNGNFNKIFFKVTGTLKKNKDSVMWIFFSSFFPEFLLYTANGFFQDFM